MFTIHYSFHLQVKLLTKTKFNYTYAEDEPVSTFVTAFYDAVLLYAYALNDSITLLGEQQALKQPINGTYLAHLMWGKSFKGITGNVTIDSNGDRISDYSLLDLNPETGMFEVWTLITCKRNVGEITILISSQDSSKLLS